MDPFKAGLILILCAVSLSLTDSQQTVCRESAIADIVFLVDGSWSIGKENFKQVQEFLYTLVDGFDIGLDKIRIGLVQYSSTPRTEFYLNSYSKKEDILQYVRNLIYKGGGTKTGLSLNFSLKNHFTASAGSRAAEGVPQVAVVITDGSSQDSIQEPSLAMKNAGITLYAIGIKDADLTELNEIASDPDDKHVYNVADFAALQGISESIIQVLCTTIEEAKRQTDQVSQACRKASIADIVFLVDGSSSVGINNFQEVRSFLYTLVESLDVRRDQVRIGLAQYNNEPYKEFLLNEYTTKIDILEEINKFPYRAGGTYTGKALDFVRREYFTESAGSRAQQNIPQILVVITDGESTDEVHTPAEELRQNGITVYVVGIGTHGYEELREIANRPSEKFLFNIDNFSVLQDLTTNLLKTMCYVVETQIQAISPIYADVIFLVDSSSNMGAVAFQQIKYFITRIVNRLDVGIDRYRIGLAQYNTEAQVEFLLNRYQAKDQVLNHIRRNFNFRGGSLMTGHAIEFLRSTFYNASAGSRINDRYPQFAIIITSARSEDSVQRAARELQSGGVTVLSIGVRNSDRVELEQMATKSFAYQLQDLIPFSNNVTKIIETSSRNKFAPPVMAPAACTRATVADIVFIVDESSSIGLSDFQKIRESLHRIVSALDTGVNNVRIGVVLYSDEPTVEFYLNTFKSEADKLQYIKTLPYRGGRTNTGAAINFARENLFTERAGSRRKQGVQQIAVVITDGESLDNVSLPASELRRSGVSIYAVGTKGASLKQLKEIASNPERKYVSSIDSINQLKNIEFKLNSQLCQEILRKTFITPKLSWILKEGCVQTEEADIYFLIDGSGSIQFQDFLDMKTFIREIIKTFKIGEDHIRIGVVQYESVQHLEFSISQYTTKQQLQEALQEIQQRGRGTNTGKALGYMRPLFQEAARTRPNVPRFLIIITDGESQDAVKRPAAELRGDGIVIYAIGIRDANTTELKDIAEKPERTFYVNNFDSLNIIKNQVIQEICSSEVCKSMEADILFLIDTSGSITEEDFKNMIAFMKSLVMKSDIGPDRVQIGTIQFSDIAQEEFLLDSYATKTDLQDAIDHIKPLKRGTKTGNALTFTSEYFDISKGGRPNLMQYLIVITDGESQDEVAKPAKALRDKGITIYAIGVLNANNTQLLEIAGSQGKVLFEEKFESLKDLEQQIIFRICHPEHSCKRTEVADIIFLVDGSDSIKETHFQSMIKFMEAVVNDTEVASNRVQFGAIVYGSEPKEQFLLKQYTTKRQVKDAIYKMNRVGGQTYTAEALRFAKDQFSPSSGGRKSNGVSQILMIITDGVATDRVAVPVIARSVREEGIGIYAVGVRNANMRDLEIIADSKEKVFYVEDFKKLENLHKTINKVLCNESKQACDIEKADIVILMDGSRSISPDNFKLMKKFMKEVVNTFVIDNNRVQVGVAQYSTDRRKEFYLNELDTSNEILNRIDSISQMDQDTYTGEALKFVKKFFEPSNGGRKNQGVPQKLLVITDGVSHDAVGEAAEALRQQNINIIAVGIGEVNLAELIEIAGSMSRVVLAQDFDALEEMKRSLVDDLCQADPPSLECSVDVAVGFDISNRVKFQDFFGGHQKLRVYLPEIMQRISTMPKISCSSGINVKLAFHIKGEGVEPVFDSDFENYSESILTKVLTLRSREATYLNAEFLQSFSRKFKRESRALVKVLLIFTDGLNADVENLKMVSENLRGEGLHGLITVVLDGSVNVNEIQQIEFGRGFGYKVPLNIGMQDVSSALYKELDTIVERKCCNVICKCIGQEGLRGPQGPPGLKGNPGTRGPPGHPGEEGGIGERGPSGLNGTQGVEGCPGPRGPKGGRGYRGEKGEDGENGIDGIDGEQGEVGLPGTSGERGNLGNPGRKGPRGEPGERGDPGLRGDPVSVTSLV
nr:PREDICTED: collagen alpha-6(VI) chain-like [Latimeria chalumnae]|eukprot:XP_014343031.1 PREDICTED: collagen alpha-6(VI) chain-like [Latimeria chalumnae]